MPVNQILICYQICDTAEITERKKIRIETGGIGIAKKGEVSKTERIVITSPASASARSDEDLEAEEIEENPIGQIETSLDPCIGEY
jgi:hypothetical protein